MGVLLVDGECSVLKTMKKILVMDGLKSRIFDDPLTFF